MYASALMICTRVSIAWTSNKWTNLSEENLSVLKLYLPLQRASFYSVIGYVPITAARR
jgi:hypothetical protein